MNGTLGPAGLTAPSFTRLSRLVGGLLALLCVVTLAAPAARDYLALVPGRCAPHPPRPRLGGHGDGCGPPC